MMNSATLFPKIVLTFNFVCLLGFKVSYAEAKGSGRGFGNHFDWWTLEDGLNKAKVNNKPVMLLIHKSWCSACKALKPEFAGSAEIKNLSKQFVMVNVEDDEEPKASKFSPDGSYIPRILFLDPGGEVLTNYYNEGGDPSYKYFYSDAGSIVASMKKVSKVYKGTTKPSDEL